MAQKSFAKSSNSNKVSNASKGGKRLMIEDSEFKIANWSHSEIDFENDMNKNTNVPSLQQLSLLELDKTIPKKNTIVPEIITIKIFSISQNILRIIGGMASLAFT